MAMLHESSVVEPLQSVADGAVKAMQQGVRFLSSLFDEKISKKWKEENSPGSRLKQFNVKRSEAFEAYSEGQDKFRHELRAKISEKLGKPIEEQVEDLQAH
jgi:hypothetical protein